jgi:hypothetical protein
MIALKVSIPQDTATATVEYLREMEKNKGPLHAAIAPAIERLSRDYIAEQSTFRHGTARSLGGRPTGELARAARKVTSRSNETEATVQFGSPLMARAFRDVTIRPGAGKKYLTLPLSGPAYGTKIRRFRGKLTFLRSGPNLVAVEFEKGRKIGTAHYLLVRSVRQKQDRTLLPSAARYTEASTEALAALINARWRN